MLRAAERALQPNPDSAAFAASPFLEVFRRSASILSVPVYLGAAIAVVLAVRRRENAGVVATLAALSTALMVAVALMTEGGFAGNLRYVALPAAMVCILAGAGWVGLYRLVRRRSTGLAAAGLAAVALVASAPFAVMDVGPVRPPDGPARVGGRPLRREPEGGDRQGRRRAGVKACGPVYTGAFQTQAVAWYLHLHETDVSIFPVPPGHHDRAPLHRERPRSALPARHQDVALDGGELLHRPVNVGSNLLSMATIAPRRPAWRLPGTVAGSARLRAPLAVGVLVLLSVLLRTRNFDVGFWIDEGLSVGIADRPLSDIPAALRLDGSPPLYYTLLHVWISVFGSTETATHALSLLFAVLAVPRPGGRRAGCSARRRPDGGAAGGHQPVPDPLRAGDADVRARGAAGRAGVRDVRPGYVLTGTDAAPSRAARGAGRPASRSLWPR